MSWLGDLLCRARESIAEVFGDSAAGSAVVECTRRKKTLHAIPRLGDRVFKRDLSGEIKAVKTSGPFATGHGGAPGEIFIAEKYALELKDGTKIEAFKSLGRLDPKTKQIVPDGRMDSDCHGVTFTNGEYWINNDQVDKMLAGGGFKAVKVAQPGDVLVYRDKHGEVVHSVTISQVDAAGKPLQVSGLGGIEMKEHFDDPAQAWHDPSATQEIWTP